MNSLIVKILEDAKLLVEQGWTQGCFARGEDGSPEGIYSRKAVSFCSVGACQRSAHNLGSGNLSPGVTAALRLLSDALPITSKGVIFFNDQEDQSKEEVLALFDRAIFNAKEEMANELP